jgi:lipopolysaccharide transport system ATP-binding protein
MPLAISAKNISKAYQLGAIGTGTLSNDVVRWFASLRGKEDPFLKIGEVNDRTTKGNSQIVWSLKDINFDIEQGEAVGIIGRNGAGKSTLLKLLSKVTSPTSGSIKGFGRIASLLEVGTGFHPELTGRENIFLNGAILGMRKKEILRKFDEIVDFSGVERYIDTPVKRYSSGMYVRLAFAVAAHLESEILIVDEVLAVGDAEFQKKCLGKMDEVSKGNGRTILFVSHQMSSIRSLCNNCIFLKNGFIEGIGAVDTIVEKYLKDGNNNKNIKFYEKFLKYVKIQQQGEGLVIEAEYETINYLDLPHLGFIIYNSYNQPIFASNPTLEQLDENIAGRTRKGKVIIEIESPQLIDGRYHASIYFGDRIENYIEDLDCLTFEVLGMTEKKQYSQSLTGNVVPKTKWSFTNYE